MNLLMFQSTPANTIAQNYYQKAFPTKFWEWTGSLSRPMCGFKAGRSPALKLPSLGCSGRSSKYMIIDLLARKQIIEELQYRFKRCLGIAAVMYRRTHVYTRHCS